MTTQPEGRNRLVYHIQANGFSWQRYDGSQAARIVAGEGLADYFTVYERHGRSPLAPYDIVLVGTEEGEAFAVGYLRTRSLPVGMLLGGFIGKFSRELIGTFDENTGEPLDENARRILQV